MGRILYIHPAKFKIVKNTEISICAENKSSYKKQK